MKKIGKEVLFLSTSEENPRNGEGCFIKAKDGRIMFVFTQYYGDRNRTSLPIFFITFFSL